MRWYRLAAGQGLATAQFLLGYMYSEGKGVPEEDTEAVRWYRLAAEQGNAGAQHNLGYMYARGEGLPNDEVQAYAWFSVAAAQGYAAAEQALEKLTQGMTGAGIAQAEELSRKYLQDYGPARGTR